MTPHPLTLADLHWLLTSPSLLNPAALPAGVVDGHAKLGEQWWQALDHQALADQLAGQQAASGQFRLGRYAEGLMHLGLGRLPDHQLLANQLAVRDGGVSLGEFDFLLQTPAHTLLHIELAVKIYIALPVGNGLCYVGPGLRDALDMKLDRLFRHQLKLAASPAGLAALPVAAPVQPMTWLRGRMFYRDMADSAWPGLAADHLRGWWRCWGEPLPQSRPDSVWRSLPKWQWLAAGQADAVALPLADWQAQAAGHFANSKWPMMVAEYAPLSAGGQELARGMLLPAGWPDRNMCQTLLHKIAALHETS